MPVAAAGRKPITGTLSRPGYTVIALAANGKATSVRAARGRFGLVPPADSVTLHLRARNGRYAGPVVVGGGGKRAIVGVKAGARLGGIKVREGYARVSKTLPLRSRDASRWARARHGVPIGAGVFGRVRSRPVRGQNRPGQDEDLDGIPSALDIDDNGNLVLDNFERSPVARAAQARDVLGLFSGLNVSMDQTVNANAAALTAQQMDAALSGLGVLHIATLPGDSAELDCGAPVPAGLPYCAPGGTGRLGYVPGSPKFPECCDPDNDGFGTLTPNGGGPFGFFLAHGATSDQIRTGDVLVERVTTSGVESQHPATVQLILGTASALVSYSDTAGHAATASYPVAPSNPPTSSGGPGTQGNPFLVAPGPDGNVVLTPTFWRPQRKPIPPETAPWIDIGGLTYLTATNPGGGVKDCPPGAYSTTDPNLTPGSIPFMPGGGGFRDLAGDRPASAANTLTYSVNLTQCLGTYGLTFNAGDERELLFMASNGFDNAQQHVFFKRQ